MTSDIGVMNGRKTASVPQWSHLFSDGVCMFTPMYVREHLASPKEAGADIRGQ